MLHVHFVRSTVRPRHDHRHRHQRGRVHARGSQGVYTSDNLGLDDFQGFADDARRRSTARSWPRARSASSATSSPPSSPRPRRRPPTPPRRSSSTYDPLPAVIDRRGRCAADAPLLFPEHGSNVCFTTATRRRRRRPRRGRQGGPGAHRQPAPGRRPDGAQRLRGRARRAGRRWASPPGSPTRPPTPPTPRSPRRWAWSPRSCGSSCPWVGGGFGPKAAVYVEYLVAGQGGPRSRHAPVKWTETRSEDMVSLVHGRDYVMDVALGVKPTARSSGLKAEVPATAGAYPMIGAILPMLTQLMSTGRLQHPQDQLRGHHGR